MVVALVVIRAGIWTSWPVIRRARALMPDATWKAAEREVARRIGGRRLGPVGRTGPDVVGEWLQVEVKTRKQLPRWICDAMAQAAVGCPADRLAIVVLHEVGERHDDDAVLLRLRDFEDWFCGDENDELGGKVVQISRPNDSQDRADKGSQSEDPHFQKSL